MLLTFEFCMIVHLHQRKSMFCQKCGQENGNDAKFCKSCGTPLGSEEEIPEVEESDSKDSVVTEKISALVTNSKQATKESSHEDKLLEAFIGKPQKVAYYANAFKKFETEGKKWNWSWWAAFLYGPFLFYRKIYTWAIAIATVTLLLNLLQQLIMIFYPQWYLEYSTLYIGISSSITIGLIIFFGGYGINLVYNNFQKIKNDITSKISDNDAQIQEMQRRGGFVAIWKLFLGYILAYFLLYGGLYYYRMELGVMSAMAVETVSPAGEPMDSDNKGDYSNFQEYHYETGEKIAKWINQNAFDTPKGKVDTTFQRSSEYIDGVLVDIVHVEVHTATPEDEYFAKYNLYLHTDNIDNLYAIVRNSNVDGLDGTMYFYNGDDMGAVEIELVDGAVHAIK